MLSGHLVCLSWEYELNRDDPARKVHVLDPMNNTSVKGLARIYGLSADEEAIDLLNFQRGLFAYNPRNLPLRST